MAINESKDSELDLEKVNFGDLPIGKNEDVEFAEEEADEADRKALQRAAEADSRTESH